MGVVVWVGGGVGGGWGVGVGGWGGGVWVGLGGALRGFGVLVLGGGARRGGRQTACFSGYPLSVFSSVICIFSFLSIGCLATPRLSMQVRDRRSLRRSRSGRGGVVCPAADREDGTAVFPVFAAMPGPEAEEQAGMAVKQAATPAA